MANIIGGVRVTGFISPTDSEDDYPVIDPLYGIDGLRNVSDTEELRNIPFSRRRAGMLVGVGGGNEYYKALPDDENEWDGSMNDWEKLSFGSRSIGDLVDTNISNQNSGDYLVYSGNTVINLSQVVISFTGEASNIGDVIKVIPDIFPDKKDNSMFFINGVKQIYGVDYNINNNHELVWLTNKYLIDNDDSLEIIYN